LRCFPVVTSTLPFCWFHTIASAAASCFKMLWPTRESELRAPGYFLYYLKWLINSACLRSHVNCQKSYQAILPYTTTVRAPQAMKTRSLATADTENPRWKQNSAIKIPGLEATIFLHLLMLWCLWVPSNARTRHFVPHLGECPPQYWLEVSQYC
jgi:hypothetical protein